jgi:CRP-like cAMP-binding protein
MKADFLNSFGRFSAEDKSLFEKAWTKRECTKNELILNIGDICQSVFFVAQGAFVQYNFKDDIEQNIIELHLENEWMLNQQSFVSQKPSETIIEAFTDSAIYELTIHQLHELIGKSPAFFQLGKVLEPHYSRIQLFDNSLSPLEKYQFVIQHRRGLLQAFPLKLIASYLKITPETLSRVREKFAKAIS